MLAAYYKKPFIRRSNTFFKKPFMPRWGAKNFNRPLRNNFNRNYFQKKKQLSNFVSFFPIHWKRHKALDLAYRWYNAKKKKNIWVTEPKHFYAFRIWGPTRKDYKKKVLSVLNNSITYLDKGIRFKKKRNKDQYQSVFIVLGENKPFWAVSWWKTGSKLILNPQWDWFSHSLKDVTHKVFFKTFKGRGQRLNKFDFKRLNAAAVRYFIRSAFKAVFTKFFSFKQRFGVNRDIKQFFFFYKKMKIFFSNYPKFLSLLSKNKPNTNYGASFLSNLAFSKVYFGPLVKDGNSVNFNISTPVWSPVRKNLAESYLIKGAKSGFHSSFYKINSFALIKYFITSLKAVFSKKKNVYISRLVKLVNARVEKMLKQKKKGVVQKKSFYRRVYFSLLLAIKKHFFKGFKPHEIGNFNKLIISPNQPKLIKRIPGARGFFFYLRKRRPKYFKSNKKFRLFKNFVRSYSYSRRAQFNIKNIMGAASRYFQAVGVKKQFKQKIYYRAFFKRMYALKDNKKMYSRWKKVKSARSKWIGFYNNFEGHLWRAARWLGFSNKVKLSRFLVENGLIFINGKVVTDPKTVVKAQDLVYLRKDVYALEQKKIWNKLTKKAISAVPFYNQLLKEKLINKAARVAKGLLRKSPFIANLHEKRIRRYKKILQDANFSIVKKTYAKSYPNLNLDRKQWERHLKKTASIKLLLAKKMLLSQPVLHSANADHKTYPKNETFYFKKNNIVMVYAKPRTVNDFFNTTSMKYKKGLNPRSIRDFIERDYKY